MITSCAKNTIMKNEILPLYFRFKGKDYSALVRQKNDLEQEQYRVTIMNGDLEMLLFGHHIFLLQDGDFVCCNPPQDSNTVQLVTCIANALKEAEVLAEG